MVMHWLADWGYAHIKLCQIMVEMIEAMTLVLVLFCIHKGFILAVASTECTRQDVLDVICISLNLSRHIVLALSGGIYNVLFVKSSVRPLTT